MTTDEKIEWQENKDFQTTSAIMESVLSMAKELTIKQRPMKSNSDFLMTATTRNMERNYTGEIKTTGRSLYKTEGFILKKAKWEYLDRDRCLRNPFEKLILVYLCKSTGEYYVFDLDLAIDEDGEPCCNTKEDELWLKQVEYDPNSPKVLTEVYLLDPDDAVCTGLIPWEFIALP